MLLVDASNIAVSAVFSQYDKNDLFKPVAFMSRKLSRCQCNFSVVERELLAIVLAVKQFSSYL